MSSDSATSDEEWMSTKKSPPKRIRKVTVDDHGERKPNKGSSTFIQKVFDMASCKRHSHAVGFSDDGSSLEIRNASLLGPVLSQYFRHGHTSSFIRQLNNYGFKTISSPSSGNDRHVFAHPNFKRDDRALLELITRKAALREKKRSKADVIKDLQQREFEQQAQLLQLEARNHELLQKAAMLDAENKSLKALLHTLKVQAGLGTAGGFDEKRFQAVLMDHQHLLNIQHHQEQQRQQQLQPHPFFQHHLPHFPSSSHEDDFFNKSQHHEQDVYGEGDHHAPQHQTHHPQPHHQLQHFHSAFFSHGGTNPNSPIHTMDTLHDIMTPMGSTTSSPEPTTSSSNDASPHHSSSALENTRMELHEMEIGGSESRHHAHQQLAHG